MEAPGDCSPSRMVVSKTTTRDVSLAWSMAPVWALDWVVILGLVCLAFLGGGVCFTPATPGRDEPRPLERPGAGKAEQDKSAGVRHGRAPIRDRRFRQGRRPAAPLPSSPAGAQGGPDKPA